MLKKQFILIFLILLVSPIVNATKIVFTAKTHPKTNLKIVNVRWDSFDVFELTAANRQTHKLICGINPFFDTKKSFLYFENYYGVDVATYELTGVTCEILFKFLQATFEGVSEENPIILSLDNMDQKVKEVLLPPLNPLQDGAPDDKSSQGPRYLTQF